MNVTECDNCRKLGPVPAPGWIVALVQAPAEVSLLSSLTGNTGADIAGMFCSWRCTAKYATAKALIPGAGS
jgi:hypothetical protein